MSEEYQAYKKQAWAEGLTAIDEASWRFRKVRAELEKMGKGGMVFNDKLTLLENIAQLEAHAAGLVAALKVARMRIFELQALLGWQMELPIEKRHIDPKYLGEQIDTALAAVAPPGTPQAQGRGDE